MRGEGSGSIRALVVEDAHLQKLDAILAHELSLQDLGRTARTQNGIDRQRRSHADARRRNQGGGVGRGDQARGRQDPDAVPGLARGQVEQPDIRKLGQGKLAGDRLDQRQPTDLDRLHSARHRIGKSIEFQFPVQQLFGVDGIRLGFPGNPRREHLAKQQPRQGVAPDGFHSMPELAIRSFANPGHGGHPQSVPAKLNPKGIPFGGPVLDLDGNFPTQEGVRSVVLSHLHAFGSRQIPGDAVWGNFRGEQELHGQATGRNLVKGLVLHHGGGLARPEPCEHGEQQRSTYGAIGSGHLVSFHRWELPSGLGRLDWKIPYPSGVQEVTSAESFSRRRGGSQDPKIRQNLSGAVSITPCVRAGGIAGDAPECTAEDYGIKWSAMITPMGRITVFLSSMQRTPRGMGFSVETTPVPEAPA